MDACWSLEDREAILSDISHTLHRFVSGRADTWHGVVACVTDLAGLERADIETLGRVHFLISDEVREFVWCALPDLLDNHRPRVRLVHAEQRAGIRGSIAWGSTMATRARRGGRQGATYVAASPRSTYESPELRLLMFVLQALDDSASRVLTGIAGASTGGWLERVIELHAVVRDAISRLEPRGVRPSTRSTSADVATCSRSSRASARLTAQAFRRYHDLVAAPTAKSLVGALRQQVLAPLDDDVLYEVWAVLAAADVFTLAGWRPRLSRLVGPSPAPFTFVSPRGRVTARIWYGHLPAAWRRTSRYRSIFDRYELAGAVRRPDMIVELRARKTVRYLLVEVKRTRDKGYIADSVYKVLGYLADFDVAFAGAEGVRGLLLLWDGVADFVRAATPEVLEIATCKDYRRKLGAVLADKWQELVCLA